MHRHIGRIDDLLFAERAVKRMIRVNELFNRGTNELRLTPTAIRRALELRLFSKFHPQTLKG